MTAQGMPVGEDVAEPIVKVSYDSRTGRASSLPRRWSLPCGPARRKEQIREGVVMQFGFFNHAESLGYDSVWVTDSQMIFSDCYAVLRSEEHTSELQSLAYLVCRLLLEKKKTPETHF